MYSMNIKACVTYSNDTSLLTPINGRVPTALIVLRAHNIKVSTLIIVIHSSR